jgi:D-arabinose 1-dehydrogenase-like Zn-dependent alcohol dehydrogenase
MRSLRKKRFLNHNNTVLYCNDSISERQPGPGPAAAREFRERLESTGVVMRAIVVRQFGDPSVLRYEETPDPEPGDGEVRIAVRAAGTNPVDAGNRADGTWAGIRLPWVPGYELSGVVDRVGPGAGNWNLALGQRVVAMTGFPLQGGGYAELAVAAASDVALLPDSVPFAAAAATPVAGGTAWEVLERLRLAEGDRLLVPGASGGVGSYLLQLAALRGIVTVAVGRREHHERLRRLGAAAAWITPAAREPRISTALARDRSMPLPTWRAARPRDRGWAGCATAGRSPRSRHPSSTWTTS